MLPRNVREELLVLPEDEAMWLNQTEEVLLLRRWAYWLSLRGASGRSARRTARVFIPRANVFTPEAPQRLMAEAERRLGPP